MRKQATIKLMKQKDRCTV